MSSCSNDESVDMENSLIVGTWNISELTYSGTSITEFNGVVTSIDYTAEGFNFDITVDFNANNTYQSKGITI